MQNQNNITLEDLAIFNPWFQIAYNLKEKEKENDSDNNSNKSK